MEDTEIATPSSRDESFRNSQMIMITEKDFGSSHENSHIHKRTVQMADNWCGYDHSLEFNSGWFSKMQLPPETSDSVHLSKRGPACSSSKQYLFVGVAADCTYVSTYNGASGALTQILQDFNTASKVYESTFNVVLTVTKVNIQTKCATSSAQNSAGTLNTADVPWNQICSSSYTIGQRLSDFSQWRGLRGNDQTGLWHLMTGCTASATGQAVGIAWLGTTCMITATTNSGSNEYVSGTGVSSVVPVEWKVVAHEIGHNFGAIHDCTAQTCRSCSGNTCNNCRPCGTGSSCDCNGQFIMHPTDNAETSSFSSASTQDVSIVRLSSQSYSL
jgi:hypothetical protein